MEENFGNCLALGKVVIPPNVTNIQGAAFIYCTNLTDVTIGSGVAILGTPHSTFVDDWGYESRFANNALALCRGVLL